MTKDEQDARALWFVAGAKALVSIRGQGAPSDEERRKLVAQFIALVVEGNESGEVSTLESFIGGPSR
jgi:hypothetical protein